MLQCSLNAAMEAMSGRVADGHIEKVTQKGRYGEIHLTSMFCGEERFGRSLDKSVHTYSGEQN